MAVALQAEGSQLGATNLAIPAIVVPTHQADDILIAPVEFWYPSTVGDPAAIPTPSGWSVLQATMFNAASGYKGGSAIFWKRATGAAETITLTNGANWAGAGSDGVLAGRVDVWRGCITTGDPFEDVQTAGPFTTGDQTTPTITPTNGTMAVIYAPVEDNVTAFGAGTDLSDFGWTVQAGTQNAVGSDSGVRLAYKASTSEEGGLVVANGTTAQGSFHYVSFFLVPPPPPVEDESNPTHHLQSAYRNRRRNGF